MGGTSYNLFTQMLITLEDASEGTSCSTGYGCSTGEGYSGEEHKQNRAIKLSRHFQGRVMSCEFVFSSLWNSVPCVYVISQSLPAQQFANAAATYCLLLVNTRIYSLVLRPVCTQT